MLIDKYGSIDYKVSGVITKTNNVILADNQFLQWTNTGKRLELWISKLNTKIHIKFSFYAKKRLKLISL